MKWRILSIGFLLLVLLAVWRLASGPIAVDFLNPFVTDVLNRNPQGWRVAVGATTLAWRGWSKPLDLSVRDVEVRNRDGERIVDLPEVALGFSLSALAHGTVGVRRIEVLNAELRIVRDKAGQLEMQGEGASQGDDVSDFAFPLIDQLLTPENDEHPLSYLDVVRVQAEHIDWDDVQREIAISASPATFAATRTDSGIRCELTMQLASGASTSKKGPSLNVELEVRRRGSSTNELAATAPPTAENDFDVAGTAELTDLDVAELGSYWSSDLAGDARSWVTENIRSGHVDEAVLHVDFERENGEDRLVRLDGTLAYQGLRVHYLTDWPDVGSVTGTGSFDRKGLRFHVASGVVGDLQLGQSQVDISGLDSDDEKIRIQVPLSGPSNGIVSLITRQSAELAALLALDSSPTPDQGTVNLDIRFPLRNQLSLADVAMSAKGELPALQTGNPYVGGTVAASADFETRERGTSSVALDLDLSKSTMAVPSLGWSKAQGVPGKATLSLDLVNLRPAAVSTLHVDAGTLRTGGSIHFADAGGHFQSVELTDVSLGRSKLSRVSVKDSENGLRIELGAGNLDVAALRAGMSDKDGDRQDHGPERPLMLVAKKLNQVEVGDDRRFEDVSVRAERDGDGWREVQLTGEIPGSDKGHFEVEVTPVDGGRRRLQANVGDAGAMFRILGVTSEIKGGHLSVAGQTTGAPGNPWHARVELLDYALLRSSLLTRLLTFASGRGFGKLSLADEVYFDYLGGEITLANGVARTELIRTHGPALGLTAEGWVDIDDEKMDVSGAIVPAYTANHILGKIPILGGLLSGDGKEGFLAIRYRMKGDAKDPKMEVHTLTSLTPAFLRDMFGRLEEVTH